MTHSVQLFVELPRGEAALVEVLTELLPEGVASLDIPRDDARYFAQVLEYSEGFRTAVNLSWRPGAEVGLRETDLGPALARRLGARVLWESDTGAWSVAHPDGRVRAVAVLELDDGVTVRAEA